MMISTIMAFITAIIISAVLGMLKEGIIFLILEYTYTNYDVSVADKDYRETCKAISDMQLELDLINQTKTFDVDL